jgi:4-amino-4-deoxy-L-arabinose transferase-like glycosyltransferase
MKSPNIKNPNNILLLVFIIIGSFLRFYQLGFNSLWLDEATTWHMSILSLPNIWGVMVSGEYNPPLFYWMEHFILLFGNSEWLLRLIPCICGIICIPVFYYIGKEMYGKRTGLICAAFCAFSPFLIYYSQEARAYVPMLLFVSLGFLFYLRKNYIIFGIFSALAFWTHFYSAIFIGAIIVFGLLRHRSREFFIGVAIFIVGILPILVVLPSLILKRTTGSPTYGASGLNIILLTIYQTFGMDTISFVVIGILVLIGGTYLIKNRQWLILFITGVMFSATYFLSYHMPMLPRYLIFLTIIIALCIACVEKIIKRDWGVYLIVGVIILISLVGLVNYYGTYQKSDWKGFSEGLNGDVVAVPGYNALPLGYYYKGNISEATNISDMTAGGKYYAVTGDIYAADPNEDVNGWLKDNCVLVKSDVTGQIYLFERVRKV